MNTSTPLRMLIRPGAVPDLPAMAGSYTEALLQGTGTFDFEAVASSIIGWAWC